MIRPILFAVLLILCVALNGCSEKKTDTVTQFSAVEVQDEHAGHDHAAQPHEEGKVEFNQNIDFAINYNDNFHAHDVGRFGGLLAILGAHQYHAELIPNEETGVVLAILYDANVKPFKTEAKELTVSLMVDGQPKQFALPADFEGSAEKPALYKMTDATLAKLLHDGWTGNALVAVTINDQPASGKLAPR